jgi:hypothetical protein
MYALFAGDVFYPQGGWRDLQGVYQTLTQAQEALARIQSEPDEHSDVPDAFEWAHVVDLRRAHLVWDWHRQG